VYQSQSSLGIHDRAKIASVGMRPAEDHGLVESYDVLVVPVMTVNMAAKCAHAICDTVPTNLLRGFLQAGKPVVAARDACDPDCPAKAAMFPDMAPGLADVFRENLARLEHIGVTLSSAADLCATTHVVLGCPAPTTPAEQRDSVRATSVEQGSVQPTSVEQRDIVRATSVEQPRSGVSKPAASAAVDCPEPVIGVRHIQTLPQGSVLRLTAAHPIITPLAHDCARDRNIRIERA
jgi:hypothetical protein